MLNKEKSGKSGEVNGLKTTRRSFLGISLSTVSLAALPKKAKAAAPTGAKRFYRGQFHTHTYWSDGRAFPEQAIRIYQEHGYDFLGISDHNQYDVGRKVKGLGGRGISPAIFEAYKAEFPDMVETVKTPKGTTAVVLSPISKLRKRFEKPGKFLLLDAVEATSGVLDKTTGIGHQVHMNYLNVPGVPSYVKAFPANETVRDRIRNTEASVTKLAAELKRETMFILNHPFWQWYDILPEDLIALPQVRFFELSNGGSGYKAPNGLPTDGFDQDRFWDIVNAFRARRGQPLLLGVGNDDTHCYFGEPAVKLPRSCMPFGAWNYVRAESLTAEALLKAMKAGDFACCTGFEPEDFAFDKKTGTLTVSVAGRKDKVRTIEFIVTKKDFSEKPIKTLVVHPAEVSDPAKAKRFERTVNLYDMTKIGCVVKKVSGKIGGPVKASYTMAPDDLYVRARVISPERPVCSDNLHPLVQTCWTQPYQR